MKKLILSIALLAITTINYAQTKATTENGKQVILNDDGTWKEVEKSTEPTTPGTMTINKEVDDMTGKASYAPSERLLCATPDQTLGFAIDPYIKNKNNKLSISDLIITMVGLGSCNEKNTLIVLFDNEEKITLTSWNKFNCKGTAYFSLLSKTHLNKLKTLSIKKIRLTNGKGFKSYTSELEYKNYFIDLFKAVDTAKP